MKQTTGWFTFEIETDLKEDEYIEVEVRIDSFFTTDSNYGADADGNRGSKTLFFDHCEYEIEHCTKESGLTPKQKKELREKVDKVAQDI